MNIPYHKMAMLASLSYDMLPNITARQRQAIPAVNNVLLLSNTIRILCVGKVAYNQWHLVFLAISHSYSLHRWGYLKGGKGEGI